MILPESWMSSALSVLAIFKKKCLNFRLFVLFMYFFFLLFTDEIIRNDFIYRFVETRVTSEVARSDCEQWGGHLLSVTSQEEQDFVESNIMYVYDKL